MNLKEIVCILLVAAVPMYAQAQSPSAPKVNKGDAEKVEGSKDRGQKIRACLRASRTVAKIAFDSFDLWG